MHIDPFWFCDSVKELDKPPIKKLSASNDHHRASPNSKKEAWLEWLTVTIATLLLVAHTVHTIDFIGVKTSIFVFLVCIVIIILIEKKRKASYEQEKTTFWIKNTPVLHNTKVFSQLPDSQKDFILHDTQADPALHKQKNQPASDHANRILRNSLRPARLRFKFRGSTMGHNAESPAISEDDSESTH